MTDITHCRTADAAKRAGASAACCASIALLRESPIGMIGAFLVLFWVVLAVCADCCRCAIRWPSPPPDLLEAGLTPAPDGGTYWLGTDDKGRDILSRLIWGSRLVLFWVDARHRRRLCRRHADGRGGRLSRRLVGRDHLVHRQCASCRSR